MGHASDTIYSSNESAEQYYDKIIIANEVVGTLWEDVITQVAIAAKLNI